MELFCNPRASASLAQEYPRFRRRDACTALMFGRRRTTGVRTDRRASYIGARADRLNIRLNRVNGVSLRPIVCRLERKAWKVFGSLANRRAWIVQRVSIGKNGIFRFERGPYPSLRVFTSGRGATRRAQRDRIAVPL